MIIALRSGCTSNRSAASLSVVAGDGSTFNAALFAFAIGAATLSIDGWQRRVDDALSRTT